jgi:hypothetical protein
MLDALAGSGSRMIINMCHLPDISRCPLYIESHVARGLGCVDDMMLPCMVERGEMDFQFQVLELARRGIAHPGMLEVLNVTAKAV